MKITMIACTKKAAGLMRETGAKLKELYPETEAEYLIKCGELPDQSVRESLSEAVGTRFHERDVFVFFTAAGIAVRTIASYLKDKFSDPAAVVIDETGKFCIPILSGHAGGANRIAWVLSEIIGAEPVITTATDREGLFSVDDWAVENELCLTDRVKAKQVSARILAGEVLKLYVDPIYLEDGNHFLAPPDFCGMQGIRSAESRETADIVVSERPDEGRMSDALLLVPKDIVVGIGCRRGTSGEQIKNAVMTVLADLGVSEQALFAAASIDLKKEEEGILAFAREYHLPYLTFSTDELMRLPGDFTGSDFVKKTTGADNICERSAMCAAGEGAELIWKKNCFDRCITVAAARRTKRSRGLL